MKNNDLNKIRFKNFLNQTKDNRYFNQTNRKRISKIYRKKLISFGDELILFDYQNTQVTFTSVRDDYSKKDTGERRADSIARSRSQIYQILTANLQESAYPGYLPSFVTLTYERNEQDISLAFKDFKYAMKKFKRYLGYSPKYLTVLEFQKRGAIHFHTIFFNIPFIPDSERVLLYKPYLKKKLTFSFSFEDIWQHGNITSKALKGVHNIAAYVTKYLTKETVDNRLFGQKVYTTSRGLYRPLETYDEDSINELMSQNIHNMETLSVVQEHQNNKTIKHFKHNNYGNLQSYFI